MTSTKLKVTGIDLFSAGDFSDDDANNEVVLRDPSRGVYKRVVLRDNKVSAPCSMATPPTAPGISTC